MTDAREYNEESELRAYILRNYGHVLTNRERALHGAATLELKAQGSPGYRKLPGYFWDEDVAAIVAGGLSEYERRCAERLIREYSHQIVVNRCEHCKRILVSPISCRCLWCGCTWYERRAELIAHAASPIYSPPKV